ncbi:hypothetical protein DFJ77DRAFT_155438 [Powellomyces hirtus]|nr:hypothetical protein DFJ77DRAFT_155438 [Powellomyces hirtus]
MSYGRWISIYYLHDSPQVFHARLGVVHGVALKRLDDVDPSVRSSYFNLLASTHPANGIADSKVFHGVPTVDTMAVPPSGTFRAKHFQLMTSYLGMQERILKGDESTTPFCPDPENFEWLRRLYHSCHSCSFDESTHGKPADNRSEMESSLSFLMFWGLWESARYCVLSRLRTPFGSPLQTFEAIEGSLKDAIATHISDSESSQVRSAEGSQSLRGHIRELQHLISFIDLLEIQTQNACEGSLQCASAPRSSIAFFHTNKKSCEEWFARVRKLLVQGAHLTGSSAVLIKHALQYLAENAPSRASASRERNFTIADTDDVLRFLADELISIKEPDMLVGIKQWLEQIGLTKPETVDEKGAQKVTLLKRTVLNDDFTSIEWCCVNHLLAEGRYEAALPALIRGHEIVRKSIGGTSGRIRNLERWYEKHITQIYLGLQNWNEMQDWLDIVRDACGEDESNASMYRRTGHHEAALRQWAQLSQRPSEQEQGEERQDYSLKNIDPAMDHGFLTAAFSISEAYIVDQLAGLQAFGEIRSVSHNPNVSRVLGDALTLSISDNPLAVPRLSMQAHLIYLIKHSLDETPPPRWNVGSTRALDASDADPLSLNLLRDTIDVLDSLASPDERRSGREAIELTVCKLARKRENFAFAMRMYQRDPDQRGQFSDGQRFEFAKLEFARGKRKEGMKALISLISNQAVSHPQSIPPPLAAKALVRLAQWIMSSPRDIWSDSDLSMALASVCGPATEVPGIVSKSKEVVENCMQQLLSKATEESKSSAKAWYKLASHAYRAARKAAEAATGPLKSHENECSSRMREISLSLSAAAPTSNEETLKSLYSLMSAELQDLPAAHGEARAERHVREAYPHASPESIREATALITAQRTAILSQLGVAATAYFKYLDVVNSKGAHVQHGNGVTAALRILRLFLKYAPLRKELAPLFSSTPIGSWESIVPQLHARIDHPDVLVREILTDLMGRIGSVTPHLIVYHALADASIDKAQDYNPSTRILNKLQHDTSDMLVPQMQRLVKELRRITVFWEETWVHKLSHLQADAMKRLQRIEGEIRRVRCSATLSDTEKERLVREYYKTIMKPLVGALESLHESTCSTVGTTAHERWFQNTFGGRINDALKMLKEPEDLSLPKKTWQPFRDIYADLNRELQRSRQLKLSDVSPYLAKFRNSVVPMPGLSLHGGNVTIQSFAADIQILPTKTKPKKIQLLGSNGVRYTYLFKGNEDLHLDERIQQLLGIINLFLTADRPSGQRNMRARTYAVIPCGPRFGMIQWVENVTPFFTLYKRWQQRDYTAKLLQRKEGETGPEIPAPLRPHEQFHAKIGQALQRHGLTSKAPRREWPQSAMKEAFQKLQHETPANLVSRELFCGSPSASSWWEKTKAFSRSTAVMSMIGYIIGLGDRHLDNILLDHTNGEVVHIDYNVCFENGAKLRVPETVPFRLTQNFHSALGVTGTEGIYSVASEHVTRVMRDNRETLLTLLEAFVYDPLVDWTRNTSDDVNRKQSEINVNIGVLASRVAEKRDTIEENVYALLAACNDAEASVRASFPKQQAQEVIRSPQDLDAALADITTKRTECEMWATRHTRALLSLKGPILQACASEVFNLETGGTFPPVAPTAYMLGPSEAHMMRCVEVDQELFRVGSEKRDCYQRCLKHLQLYRALAAPIAEPLLEQDHFLQWSRLLQSVLEAPEDLSTYEHVYSYSFEEGLTAHTRKAALEAVMKSTCLAKDIEWQKARENVEALQEGTGADAMESFSAIFGTDGSYKNSDVVVNCFLLGELADLGRLLFAWIKEPEGAADITSEIACNVKSTAEKAVAIFGFYSFEPDNLHNVHALITYASMSAGIMQRGSRYWPNGKHALSTNIATVH